MLSFLKRKDSPGPANAVDEAASVQVARTRARRRLVGAAVLLGVAIVGFPLLFETRPRPIPVDIPIEVAARVGASAPAATAQGAAPGQPAARAAVSKPAVVERSGASIGEAPVEPAAPLAAAPTPVPTPVPTPAPAPALAAASASAVARAPAASAPLRADRPAVPEVAANRAGPAMAESQRDAQRAQALLDGKADVATVAGASGEAVGAAEPKAARFVVQAGAYSDAAALREARQKVEKLGMKTYTQVVDAESGARTRVRVGPFATRDEAEKAAARIKGSGLAANVLSL